MNPRIQSLIQAYWLNRLGHNDPAHTDPDPLVKRYSRLLDDYMVELIERELVEYDPVRDTSRWIGPKRGSPEWKALIEKEIAGKI
jgi:hypothetical protein